MPDLASLMGNPAIMSMAQQMAQGGGLDRLMGDPAVANMVGMRYLNSAYPLMTDNTDEPCTIWRYALDGGAHVQPPAKKYVSSCPAEHASRDYSPST